LSTEVLWGGCQLSVVWERRAESGARPGQSFNVTAQTSFL